jgi:hypothetical protein
VAMIEQVRRWLRPQSTQDGRRPQAESACLRRIDWLVDHARDRLDYVYTVTDETDAQGSVKRVHRVALLGVLSYLPIELRENGGLVQRTRVALRGLYHSQATATTPAPGAPRLAAGSFDLVNLVAGAFHPERLGVSQLYGVVGTCAERFPPGPLPTGEANRAFARSVAENCEERRSSRLSQRGRSAAGDMPRPASGFERAYVAAREGYEAMWAALLAAFEQCRLDPVDRHLAGWLRRALAGMPYAVSVVGNPDPRETPRGMGRDDGPGRDREGGGPDGAYALQQSEMLMRGLAGREQDFVFLAMTRHVAMQDIAVMLEGVADEASLWASRQRGSKAINLGLSMPVILSASSSMGVGESHGESHSRTTSDSVGEATGISHGVGQSHTTGHAVTTGQSLTESLSSSHGVTTSESSTSSVSESVSTGSGHTDNVSSSDASGHANSASSSWGESQSSAHGTNSGSSTSVTDGVSHTVTDGSSHTTSNGSSWGSSTATSSGTSSSDSTSVSAGTSHSDGSGQSSGWNANASVGGKAGLDVGIDAGLSGTVGGGFSHGDSTSTSDTVSGGTSSGHTDGVSTSTTTASSSGGYSGVADSTSHSESNGTSHSTGQGTYAGVSDSSGTSTAVGGAMGSSDSRSHSDGSGTADSVQQGRSSSSSWGHSSGIAQSQSESRGLASSRSASQSLSDSDSVSVSDGVSRSLSRSHGMADGAGTSDAVSVARSSGLGGSVGLGPSLSLSKTYAWEDDNAQVITSLYRLAESYLYEASREGAFLTDVYCLTKTPEGQRIVETLVPEAFHGTQNVLSPVMTRRLDAGERASLLVRAQTLSPSEQREEVPGGLSGYRHASLLPIPQAAVYFAPAAFEEGKALTMQERIPPFAFMVDTHGEVELANLISPETGIVTESVCRLSRNLMANFLLAGDTGAGKTIAAERLAVETTSRWHYRTIVLDFGAGWRKVLSSATLGREHKALYQLHPGATRPLRWNPLQIGLRVDAEEQLFATVNLLANAGRMGERQTGYMRETLRALYTDCGVLLRERAAPATGTAGGVDWFRVQEDEAALLTGERLAVGKRPVAIGTDVQGLGEQELRRLLRYRSRRATLAAWYARLQERLATIPERNQTDRASIQGVLLRLEPFAVGKLAGMYNDSESPVAIEDLGYPHGLVVIEGGASMDEYSRAALFSLLAWHLYSDAVARRRETAGRDLQPVQLFFEEANKVLTGVGGLGHGEGSSGARAQVSDIFESMWRDSRKYSIYLHLICQSPSEIPGGIVSSCNNSFVFQLKNPRDRDLAMAQLARSEKGFTDEHYKRFLSRMAKATAVLKLGTSMDIARNEPMYVRPIAVDLEEPDEAALVYLVRNGAEARA